MTNEYTISIRPAGISTVTPIERASNSIVVTMFRLLYALLSSWWVYRAVKPELHTETDSKVALIKARDGHTLMEIEVTGGKPT